MYHFFKRTLDIVASGIALLILAPLLIPIMIGLKLTGEGYIFYLQERVGYKNRLFHIYKFATMLKDSPNMPGGFITTRKDPRLTPMGGFLRKSKINELPQLWNIFKGDMSIVGPRPVIQPAFDKYPDQIQKVIYNVKPGLTGIGSIIFRDEEALVTEVKNTGGDVDDFYTNSIVPHKGDLELWYQKHRSFWVDLKIIIITAWVIFFPESDLVYRWFPTVPRRPF